MIRITDKSLCCGCTACVNACPVQCIVMRRDREGFDYPVANPDICIGCGKCETVCPVLKPRQESAPLSAYAARCDEYVGGSSSGGIFPLLAEKVIGNGGTVYGAAFNPDMTVGHTDVCDVAGLARLGGSKYVQSDLYAVFEEIKNTLAEGGKVLFSGTPCQVAGLRSYLGEATDRLLTVDVACHGVPSPGLWEAYVAALGRKYGGKVVGVSFRDKTKGWRRYGFKIEIDGASGRISHLAGNGSDPYMSLFLQDMTLRPSCYGCPARNGRSGSDITLADLWNVSEAASAFDDDRGVSLVLVNTAEGKTIFEDVVKAGTVSCLDVDTEVAVRGNGGFAERIEKPERRNEFFSGLHSADDLLGYMKGFVRRKPFHLVIYRNLRHKLSAMKRRVFK